MSGRAQLAISIVCWLAVFALISAPRPGWAWRASGVIGLTTLAAS